MRQDTAGSRWARRPGWARLVRLAVFCAPVLASFGAALAVRAVLPSPAGTLERAGTLAALVAVSTLVLLAVDRLGRRALPLVTLLDLSMLFPDRAPSRLGVAREAIRRRPIEEQLRRVRDAGADPGAVAREILALVAAMSAHDRPTRGHAERVRMFTDLLAQQMGIPARDRDLLRWASILHDIGKLRVPASLLNKPAKPTEEEWTLLKAHPSDGAEMAAGLLPWLGQWGAVILEHHERYDGTGYPNGLAGKQISVGARIVSVADAYDVMTAARAYKRPVGRAAACRELVRYSGTQFDPAVVRAMVAVGAPRLRRAQGVVSWIADIPLIASGTVPAATVARIVGAGALATGAVTGGALVGGSLDTTPSAQASVTVSDSTPVAADGAARAQDVVSARKAPGLASPAGPSSPVEDAPPADQAPRTGGGTSGAPSPSVASTSSRSTRPVPHPADDPVGTTVDTVSDPVGTVKGVVSDPVGTVKGVVSDPVGTVTGTVGTVGDVAGGLVGGVVPSPGPSPSPSASPGGGVLGSVLDALPGG